MVILHVKRGEEPLFDFECGALMSITDITRDICSIYNSICKIRRIASELEELMNHGISLPPEMIGLTQEQIQELKLVDLYTPKCYPTGGHEENVDPMGRRNGQKALAAQAAVLQDAIEKAKSFHAQKEFRKVTMQDITDALKYIEGAVRIVYVMGLPPYDPIHRELNNTEDLVGTQAELEVIEPAQAILWFAGKQLLPDKRLDSYIGNNEHTKISVKLARIKDSAPSRISSIDEETRRSLYAAAYKRQEELKKLEQDDDDNYLNSTWADNQCLKHQAHGLTNIKFRFN